MNLRKIFTTGNKFDFFVVEGFRTLARSCTDGGTVGAFFIIILFYLPATVPSLELEKEKEKQTNKHSGGEGMALRLFAIEHDEG